MTLGTAAFRIEAFFFAPATDNWLALLRLGLGSQLACYCLALNSSWSLFLSGTEQGLITREFAEVMVSSQSPFIPRISWLIIAGNWVGLEEQTSLTLVWFALFLAACCLVAGFCCRTAACSAWLLHLGVAKSAGLFSYGVDNLMTIGLFYLMLSPLPDGHALDARRWRRRPSDPRMLRFFCRVLQLHLCLIYFFGGLTKCLGRGWWDGSNIWRALTRPPFNVISPDIIASWSFWLPAIGIATWIVELAYPAMIWPARTRPIWLTLTCAMHLAIGFAMGMYLFAFVMIVLNVAAFGTNTRSAVAASHPTNALS